MKRILRTTSDFLVNHRHSLLHAAAFVVAFLDSTRHPRQTPSPPKRITAKPRRR